MKKDVVREAPASYTPDKVKLATEIWVATALLHCENPMATDFSTAEILARARREELQPDSTERGLRAHVTAHCVANRRASPARIRMLVATGHGRRRLYRPGDETHPDRARHPYLPTRAELPSRLHYLLDWYASDFATEREAAVGDPLLALRGLGREIWQDESADAYVERLREGWV